MNQSLDISPRKNGHSHKNLSEARPLTTDNGNSLLSPQNDYISMDNKQPKQNEYQIHSSQFLVGENHNQSSSLEPISATSEEFKTKVQLNAPVQMGQGDFDDMDEDVTMLEEYDAPDEDASPIVVNFSAAQRQLLENKTLL